MFYLAKCDPGAAEVAFSIEKSRVPPSWGHNIGVRAAEAMQAAFFERLEYGESLVSNIG